MPRKLVDGTEVPDHKEETRMTIASRCPGKWLFLDLETGDVWEYKEKPPHKGLGHFWAASDEQLRAAKLVIDGALQARR